MLNIGKMTTAAQREAEAKAKIPAGLRADGVPFKNPWAQWNAYTAAEMPWLKKRSVPYDTWNARQQASWLAWIQDVVNRATSEQSWEALVGPFFYHKVIDKGSVSSIWISYRRPEVSHMEGNPNFGTWPPTAQDFWRRQVTLINAANEAKGSRKFREQLVTAGQIAAVAALVAAPALIAASAATAPAEVAALSGATADLSGMTLAGAGEFSGMTLAGAGEFSGMTLVGAGSVAGESLVGATALAAGGGGGGIMETLGTAATMVKAAAPFIKPALAVAGAAGLLGGARAAIGSGQPGQTAQPGTIAAAGMLPSGSPFIVAIVAGIVVIVYLKTRGIK